MRIAIALASTLVALALAACGSDDETTSAAAGTSGATGEQGPASGGGTTVSEFIDESIPDQVAAVQEAAEADPACSGANTDAGGDLQVSVAIEAAQADPETPLSEIVAEAC